MCTLQKKKTDEVERSEKLENQVKGNPTYWHILVLFTSKPCKLNRTILLLTHLYVHMQRFLSNKLRSLCSSHGWLRKLVFLFSQRGSHFIETSH